MNTKPKSGAILLLSDSLDQYIPRNFCQNFHFIYSNADNQKGWKNVTYWAQETCLYGPDAFDYWEAWDYILNAAEQVDLDGNKWILHQDGDLWAICPDLMTAEERMSFGFNY